MTPKEKMFLEHLYFDSTENIRPIIHELFQEKSTGDLYPLFMECIEYPKEDAATIFIEKGIPLFHDIYRPFVRACETCGVNFVKLLLKNGADFNEVDLNGMNGFCSAIYHENYHVLQFLIQHTSVSTEFYRVRGGSYIEYWKNQTIERDTTYSSAYYQTIRENVEFMLCYPHRFSNDDLSILRDMRMKLLFLKGD
jgi:hypothetical protein